VGLGGGKAKKRKVGLALGSGAAWGLAHIGVLEVLEKEDIPIDMIAGTSMGAMIGALYAVGKGVSQIKELVLDLGARRFSFLADPALPKTGLLRGRKIENVLRSVIGNTEFGELRIPFACVATDIDSGEEVVIERGPVWRGVRASGSVPVMLTPVRLEGKYLVDGGLVNPVPVSVLKTMGADFIIAVNVIPHRSIGAAKEPNIFGIVMQMVYIISYRVVRSSLAGADVVIEPQMEHISVADFHRAQECILHGEWAAQEAIPEIKRHI